MTDPSFLALLQHGDSFFPGGATSFSWGLEGLCADGIVVDADDVSAFVAGQLSGRWAGFDWPVTRHAFDHADDLDALCGVDARVEAQTLACELRVGSRRAGAALLGVHARLGTPRADAYRRRIARGDALGHLAIVQGMVWRGAGVGRDALGALSAHSLCIGLLGAAVRLGVIGHVDAQRILTRVAEPVAEALDRPACPIEEIAAFAPQTEIASMRHETAEIRLFMN